MESRFWPTSESRATRKLRRMDGVERLIKKDKVKFMAEVRKRWKPPAM